MELKRNCSRYSEIEFHFKISTITRISLKGCHFSHRLDATVEEPKFEVY